MGPPPAHPQTKPQMHHSPGLDRYLIIHVATTCDEHGVYVTKDSAETIELGWILQDAKTLEEIARDNVLVKPVNTPVTPLCTSLTTLTWESVHGAGDFKAAIHKFESFVQKYLSGEIEWAFVTLDSWDLRVQLPREARDKGVVLPLYLQHSRTFDIKTEYQRWQAYHPESLVFSASTLENICFAVEAKPVQNHPPIKDHLPFHLHALAPAAPRRAIEDAVTISRVLKGLIQKSQPPSKHPDVLSRPMDAQADVRAFLGERSKVLHMSGLPHDTTQSELESWFTSYGGRPIAFWTLRTPEQHKPTGTGFAVFSSHEEAAESLCMNGRALNEKAIEVSPSSSRVLDRAAEILMPFPPSKNRPRPGDWNCPACNFSNFQRRTNCFRCNWPQGFPGFQGFVGSSNANNGNMGRGGNGQGYRQRNGGGSGNSIPFRPGDWKCGSNGCNYHNFAKNQSCLRCGGFRANASLVAGADYNPNSGAAAVTGASGPPVAYATGPSNYNAAPGPSNYNGAPGPSNYNAAPGPSNYNAAPGPSNYNAAPGPSNYNSAPVQYASTSNNYGNATYGSAPAQPAPGLGYGQQFNNNPSNTGLGYGQQYNDPSSSGQQYNNASGTGLGYGQQYNNSATNPAQQYNHHSNTSYQFTNPPSNGQQHNNASSTAQNYNNPPSTYALPSGLGATGASYQQQSKTPTNQQANAQFNHYPNQRSYQPSNQQSNNHSGQQSNYRPGSGNQVNQRPGSGHQVNHRPGSGHQSAHHSGQLSNQQSNQHSRPQSSHQSNPQSVQHAISHYANAGSSQHTGVFDSRAESAFTSAGQSSSGAPGISNGSNHYAGGYDSTNSYPYLSTTFGSLSMNDKNGGPSIKGKGPAS